MALVEVTLSCTGTGTATMQSQPTKVLSTSGTSVPKLLKLPARILSTSGTSVPKLLKSPARILSTSGSNTVLLTLVRFGIDTFDILEGRRKWIIENVPSGWQVKVKKRFTFLVRGRPGG